VLEVRFAGENGLVVVGAGRQDHIFPASSAWAVSITM
jgi:hypothetical protein